MKTVTWDLRIVRPRIPDEEKMVLHPADTLLRAFSDKLTPAASTHLACKFKEYLGQPHHPQLISNELLACLCEACFADRSYEEALEAIGFHYTVFLMQAPLARLSIATLALLSIDWYLRNIPRNWAATRNFGTYSLAQLGPRHWRLDVEDELCPPEFMIGIFQGAREVPLLRTKMPGQRSKYSVLAPGHISFEMCWDDR